MGAAAAPPLVPRGNDAALSVGRRSSVTVCGKFAAICGAFEATRGTGGPMNGPNSTDEMISTGRSLDASTGGVTTRGGATGCAAAAGAGRTAGRDPLHQTPATTARTIAAANARYAATAGFRIAGLVPSLRTGTLDSSGNSQSTCFDGAEADAAGIDASVTNEERAGAASFFNGAPGSRARASP